MNDQAEQLEFELWSEMKISAYEMVSNRQSLSDLIADMPRGTIFMQDPCSMFTIVRYRV